MNFRPFCGPFRTFQAERSVLIDDKMPPPAEANGGISVREENRSKGPVDFPLVTYFDRNDPRRRRAWYVVLVVLALAATVVTYFDFTRFPL